MGRERTLQPIIEAPTHNGVVKPCLVMTECAFHTVELKEGHFACIVLSLPGEKGPAAIAILDRDEVETHITLLRNSMEDAERLDAGKPTKHAAQSLVRS